jgi:uncharacterized protein YndB with AHSA1/START domain
MTTTGTHETEVNADPDVPLIRTTREFDASPAKVFRAHTDPELLVQWFGPRSTETLFDHYDCRTGGTYRYRHISGRDEFIARGCFHEVRPSDLIVQTCGLEDGSGAVGLERFVFEDLGGRTRLTTTLLVDSFQARDAIISSGMEYGVREGYERLDDLLPRLP